MGHPGSIGRIQANGIEARISFEPHAQLFLGKQGLTENKKRVQKYGRTVQAGVIHGRELTDLMINSKV